MNKGKNENSSIHSTTGVLISFSMLVSVFAGRVFENNIRENFVITLLPGLKLFPSPGEYQNERINK